MDPTERRAWLKATESRIGFEKEPVDAVALVLYFEARRCYVFGAPLAASVMAVTAMDQLLRHRMTVDEGVTFAKTIEIAERDHLIPATLAQRLHHARKPIRNMILHESEEALWGSLGMTRRSVETEAGPGEVWEESPYVDSDDFEDVAQECILAFLELGKAVQQPDEAQGNGRPP